MFNYSKQKKYFKLFRGRDVMFLVILMAVGFSLKAGAQTIVNGNLENWGAVSGTPATGTPSGWTVSTLLPIQGTGLVGGSNFSAIVQKGSGSTLGQNISGSSTDFTLSFDFASGALATASARSMTLLVNQGTSFTNVIDLRVSGGSTTSLLSLQAFNGTAWVTLAADAFQASTFNAAGTGFTTLNAYDISLTANLAGAASSYSLTYGLDGGTMTTLSDLTTFISAPTSDKFSSFSFTGANGAANFAVDNVVVAQAVPEPPLWGLALIGLSVGGCLMLRRRVCA